MIRAVHLNVAIHAALPQQELRWHGCCDTACILGDARVTTLRVAALAQHGRPSYQHAGMIRAVRRVTQRTILGYRRVFPKERTTLAGMTAQASAG